MSDACTRVMPQYRTWRLAVLGIAVMATLHLLFRSFGGVRPVHRVSQRTPPPPPAQQREHASGTGTGTGNQGDHLNNSGIPSEPHLVPPIVEKQDDRKEEGRNPDRLPAAGTGSQSVGVAQKGREEEARGPGLVQLNFMGRLGNNLFEYATARALADRLGWALSLQAAPGNKQKYSTLLRAEGMACFPGVRPLGPQASSPEMSALEVVWFRGVRQELEDTTPRTIWMQDWFQDYQLFAEDKDRIRQVNDLEMRKYSAVEHFV